MKRLYRIKVTPRAQQEIHQASAWWKENRSQAATPFSQSIRNAFDSLSRQPRMGSPARNAKLRGVRRLFLKKIRYYLYYRVVDKPPRVEVLALWHSKRGSEPDIDARG